MATVKKYQTGGDVPKGMVRGEMTGRLYTKEAMDKHEAGMADALDRQAGLGKYAPKKNEAINNNPYKESMMNKKTVAKPASKKMADGGKFGMLSVKAGVDKNPKVTFADKIAGAKKMAKSGTKLVPKKNSVSKNISNLNKARGGAKMKKGC